MLILLLTLFMAPGPVAASVLRSSGETVLNWQQQLSGYLDRLTKRNPPQQAAPTGVKPAPPETKAEKEARVASIVVSPRNEVTMMSRESKIFTGIPVDNQGGTVQGLMCEWRSTNNQVIFIRKNGMAVAGNSGTAELIVQAGNKSRRVNVTVVSNPSNEKYPGKKKQTDSARTGGGIAGKNGTGSVVPNTTSGRKLAHASRLYSPAAPMPIRNPNEDPLPDNETASLYDQTNLVGHPEGKLKAGASTASVANASMENGNKNFNFGLPVMSLGGRGIDVSLGLVYNSQLWHKSASPSTSQTWLTYDVDSGYPAQGFRLGFGQVEDQGSAGYTLVDADGTRHALTLVSGYEYKSNDGTFIKFLGTGGFGTVYQADGTIITYGCAGGGDRMYPTIINDVNGNYITITYLDDVGPRIDTITDTMGRYIRFYYDSNDELVTITVPGFSGGSDRQVMRFYYDNISVGSTSTLFDTVSVNVSTTPSSIRGIKYIYLPDSAEGSSSSDGDTGYRFDYSPYGMVRQITRFQGMTASSTSTTSTGTVTEGSNTVAATTTYNYPTSGSGLTDAPTYTQRTDDWAGRTTGSAPTYTFETIESSTEVLTRVIAPDGGVTETVSIKNSGQWDDGLVKETRIQNIPTPSPSPSPTATPVVYAKKVITWQQSYTNGPARIADIRQTNEAGKTRARVYSYDDANTPYNNVTVVSERDFTTNGTISSTELRKIVKSYVTSSSYLNRRILHLASSVRIRAGGSSTDLARVDYEYDNYGTSHANMTARSDIIMHLQTHDPFQEDQEIWEWVCTDWHMVGEELVCTNYEWQMTGTFNYYDSNSDYRGNVTSATTYTDAPGALGAIIHDTYYDIAGNVTRAEVDCCQEETIAYNKTFEYAYPVSITKGDPGGLHLTTTTSSDFNTGVIGSITDPNNQVTSVFYNSDTVRPSQIDFADGGRTSYNYEDALVADSAGKYHWLVTTTTKLDASRNVASKSYFDGRGRVAAIFDSYTSGDGWTIRNIEYDNMGRAYRVSNPYHSTSNYGTVAINSSAIWTTNTFDLPGRVTQVQMPRGDDSNLTHVNTVSTSYAGDVITSTDQAGKMRRAMSDALGRMVRLDEPTTSGPGTVGSPNQATTYDYDLLDNLVKITQGAQSRYFKYDSLSRLIRERQPEQNTYSGYNLSDSLTGNSAWTKKLDYNSHGLVTDVYDALGQHTEFSYDPLNRLTLIDYPGSTPDSRYFYDSTSNLPSGYPSYTANYTAGRLVGMTYGSSGSALTGTYFGYDKLGRITEQRQKTGSNTFALTYTYNLAGLLATETYPTGRELTHSYDDAGRLLQISDGTTTFTSGISYAPSGTMLSEAWGNGAIHSLAYNNAQQVKQIKLNLNSNELQRFDYFYGEVNQSNGTIDLTKNNGQIGRIDGAINNTKQWEQRYSYDELGRLSTAAEFYSTGFSTSAWQQQFTYDRYGNRLQSGSGNTGVGFTPVVSGDITSTTNRFISAGSTPITYDDAGNITQDMKFRLDPQGNGMIYTYDPNGRQLTAKRSDNTGSVTSTYDCVGQRVQTSGQTVVRQMVYDIFGQLVEDYRADPSGTAQMTGVERENIYRGGQLLAVYESDACYKTIGNFVIDFYVGAFGAGATTTYATDIATWADTLTRAQAQSTNALLGAAQQLGISVFGSSAYTGLGTTNTQYVNDLYEAYLQRDPAADPSGVAFWTNEVVLHGRTQVRLAFASSTEFNEKVVKLCPGTSSSTSTSANLKYILSDAQGSARVLMENNGTSSAILARHDYLPYGEDISAGVGSRTTGQKYSITDKVRQRFAGTERDEANGLDHTWFRKLDSFAGRFTSPDPMLGDLNDPQSLNRYAYTGNDPINLVDPSGLMKCEPGNYSAMCDVSGFGGWGGGFDMNERNSSLNPTGALVISEQMSKDVRFVAFFEAIEWDDENDESHITFKWRKVDSPFNEYLIGGRSRSWKLGGPKTVRDLGRNWSKIPSPHRDKWGWKLRYPAPELEQFPKKIHMGPEGVEYGPDFDPNRNLPSESKQHTAQRGAMNLIGHILSSIGNRITIIIVVTPALLMNKCNQNPYLEGCALGQKYKA
jgi:RHS repeat-associated protein